MSDTAKNIVEGFRKLRDFCNEVAKMLGTADGMMIKGNWTPVGNRAASSTSRVLGEPDSWLPTEFFRYYEREDSPNLLPFIAVLLHDPVVANETVINEALVAAGCIEFEEGMEYDFGKWCWACRSHLFMGNEDRKDDGTRYSVIPKDEDWDEDNWIGVAKVDTFAYPLDEKITRELLKEKIVQPLLKLLVQEKSQQ